MNRISEAVAALLEQAVVVDNVVRPLPAVDREIYEEFNEVLVRLRGKWKRGKGHVFPYDPSVALEAVRTSLVMPDKNPLAYFPTPTAIAMDLVAELHAMDSGLPRTMLEPSAGSGALADAVRARWPDIEITAVEMDPLNAAMLRAKGYRVIEANFLDVEFEGLFDIVAMNPPFAVDGDRHAWVAHLRRAWDLLDREHGRMACIAPAGAWQQSSRKPFPELRTWMTDVGAWLDVHDPGAFKDSGTGVATLTLLARRCHADARDLDHESDLVWMLVDNDQPWLERKQALLSKPADDDAVLAFMREAVTFSNGQGSGGVAMTPSLLRVLANDWEDTRRAAAAEASSKEFGETFPRLLADLATLEDEADAARARMHEQLASIGFSMPGPSAAAPVAMPPSLPIPPPAMAREQLGFDFGG